MCIKNYLIMFDNVNLKKYNNIYIYGFGLTGKWLSENLNTKVEAFIDTDEKKSGFQYNSVRVLSVNDAEKIVGPNDLIIVTIVDIQDIIYILDKKFSKTQWLPYRVAYQVRSPKITQKGFRL